tara:strand:+ start:101 stop:448 length:348 start_codon:yes stop_codon:yes gene_type:complete
MEDINDPNLIIAENIEQLYDTINENPVIKYLTKYEKTKVIQQRANEIMNNSPLYISVHNIDKLTAIDIAEIELYSYKIPYIIARQLPYDKIEYVKLNTLILLDPINHKLLSHIIS